MVVVVAGAVAESSGGMAALSGDEKGVAFLPDPLDPLRPALTATIGGQQVFEVVAVPQSDHKHFRKIPLGDPLPIVVDARPWRTSRLGRRYLG